MLVKQGCEETLAFPSSHRMWYELLGLRHVSEVVRNHLCEERDDSLHVQAQTGQKTPKKPQGKERHPTANQLYYIHKTSYLLKVEVLGVLSLVPAQKWSPAVPLFLFCLDIRSNFQLSISAGE